MFAESGPLGGRRTCSQDTRRRRPLFFIPRAAILRDGALSGTFHPNVGRHKDMTITADFSCRGRSARCLARPPTAGRRMAGPRVAGRRMAGPRIAGRQTSIFRDALSLSPFRLPEFGSDAAQRLPIPQGHFLRGGGLPSGRTAWRVSIPSPGFSAGIGVSVCNSVCK
jgi:hypothetical protein